MSATMLRDYRLQRLRGLEPYVYQIAHYILQNDRLAAEAAKAALLEISRTNHPLEESEEELRSLAKKAAMSASIRVARSAAIAQ